jgi:demethylmenaquinone methyltransferase/2-methoxy-6-polyprenyl-1,4-benzoquinol methylase
MKTNSTKLTEYYAKRAREYERIYMKRERQTDLKKLEEILAEAFTGQDVLEIACGTGYWTRIASRSARSIIATDYNDEVMAIARSKDYGTCPVEFMKSDAYVLDEAKGLFSAALLGFWWSHVRRSKLVDFLDNLHSRLLAGAMVIVLDNKYVEGSSTPISRKDKEGNTYQIRDLMDGSHHEVLKNFPTRDELSRLIAPISDEYEIVELDYYWLARYTLKRPDGNNRR